LEIDIQSASLSPCDTASFSSPKRRGVVNGDDDVRTIDRVAVIDSIKAISSQLIVLHHFCIYGPMTDAAWGLAPALFKLLANDGRLAVQCFLVMAGFLAAGTLLPGGSKPWSPPAISSLPRIFAQRYARLAKVYLVGLAAAIACAAIARGLIDDPSTPAEPTLGSLAAHIFFLQDLFGIPSLTAGAWYVAIDLQLYGMLVLICAASTLAARSARSAKFVAMSIACVVGLSSLLLFNRNPELEIWGIYFFGSYSLGMAARWASQAKDGHKWAWLAAMALVCAFALCVQWRSRIAVSTITAFFLAAMGAHRSSGSNWLARVTSYLSRISFPLFVLHYPVLMLIGSVVKTGWGDDPTSNALGLCAAWLLSMAAASALTSRLDHVARKTPAMPGPQFAI
jgi:peptidoglycan/LPS O-acetylase OafA/YrhL